MHIGDYKLVQSDCIDYLGVKIDETISWNKQTDNICKKKVFIISRFSRLKHSIPSHMLMLIYSSRPSSNSETQFGGIKDRSTTLALITMLHHVLQRLERKDTYARILLIDFSKAFDHIDHNILLDKLKTNGVPQICVEWQKAFLTSRTQRVNLANTKSDWTEVAGGVPQGTLSGPENFLNMIDDRHTDVDDVKFIDDVTLYEVCNTHSQNKLQNDVDDIQEWATDNK